jgi:hypothetical protein
MREHVWLALRPFTLSNRTGAGLGTSAREQPTGQIGSRPLRRGGLRRQPFARRPDPVQGADPGPERVLAGVDAALSRTEYQRQVQGCLEAPRSAAVQASQRYPPATSRLSLAPCSTN